MSRGGSKAQKGVAREQKGGSRAHKGRARGRRSCSRAQRAGAQGCRRGGLKGEEGAGSRAQKGGRREGGGGQEGGQEVRRSEGGREGENGTPPEIRRAGLARDVHAAGRRPPAASRGSARSACVAWVEHAPQPVASRRSSHSWPRTQISRACSTPSRARSRPAATLSC